MNEKLNEAMNEVSDSHLAEALRQPHNRMPVLGAIAAILALAILLSVFLPMVNPGADPSQPSVNLEQTIPSTSAPKPSSTQHSVATEPSFSSDPTEQTAPSGPPSIELLSGQLAAPIYPTMAPYPVSENGFNYSHVEYTAWTQSRKEQYDQPKNYAGNLGASFAEIIFTLLEDSGTKNTVCSPVNLYMALAMLAESTGGTSRSQILQLLNADSLDSLRTQAGHIWNAHYCNDGATASVLANSLWLDEKCTYDPATVSILSQRYYASLFRGDLGSDEMNKSLQDWLNQQTAGLLQQQAGQVTLDPNTVLALASTICYRAKWDVEFSEKNNTQGIFHTPEGDITCAFMNRTEVYGVYYYGQDYSATRLDLKDGNSMWFILPDEGHTPQSVLQSGHAIGSILLDEDVQSVSVRVNLSVPKFDIVSDTDLSPALQSLGITDVFDSNLADFSPILPEDNAWLEQAKHAVRVAIDEEGISAVAYTALVLPGNAMPPEEEVDFILDQPFLFLVTSRDGLPLFAGIVNQP